MKQPLPAWVIGVVAAIVVGAVCVYGFVNMKKASEPEIDRTKPPASFYDSYKKVPGADSATPKR